MDDLLQQGITAYKTGKQDEARQIFIAVVRQNQNSERAWIWMYNVCNIDQERIYCLKQILRINPKNEKARQFLNKLTGSIPALSDKPLPVRTKQKFSQQQNILIAIASLLFICCLCVGFWLLLSPSNDDKRVSPTPISSVSAPISLPTQPIINNCNPAYPDVCIAYDQSCIELKAQGISNFRVLHPDPFELDGDKDGIGCEN